jgi:ubiquinone/menaquinone biosynthesis C-methylase UbiE
VNFLEVHNHNIQTYPQSVIDFNRDASAKIPIRENILLKHGYSKLLSTYKLFDTYDTQLLRLSSLAISNFNEILADIFLSMFKYEVKKENFRPDIQSEQLHKILVNKIENSENENIKILEYGTGEGRMFKNVSKISNRKNVEKAHWFLYEPMMTQRKLLRENYELTLSNIFEIPETLPDAKFDIIFLANVLHELSPNAIAETLSYSASHLMKDGIIVIIELHPLLNPEKYSVSLAANEWSNLAMKLGFSVYSGQIPIKNSMHEAYFVKLSLKQNQLYEEKILEKRISNFWKTQILKNRIGEYDGGQDITDIEEIGKTLRLLTTITSITAYSTGLWDSKSKIE